MGGNLKTLNKGGGSDFSIFSGAAGKIYYLIAHFSSCFPELQKIYSPELFKPLTYIPRKSAAGGPSLPYFLSLFGVDVGRSN